MRRQNEIATRTYSGGAYGGGVVFQLTFVEGKWGGRVLHAFSGKPGAIVCTGLVFDTAGNLFGATRGYPVVGYGSVYEITP